MSNDKKGGTFMWTRAQLKNQAKETLKRNYWKAVLVGLLCIILGTSSGLELRFDLDEIVTENNDLNFSFSQENSNPFNFDNFSVIIEDEYNHYSDDYYDDGIYDSFYDFDSSNSNSVVQIATRFMILVLVLLVIVGITGILLSTFILNPLQVGASRFFLKNLEKNAQIGEVGFAFDTEYKNVTKIMFFRGLYTILWSFLFLIPGIVKSYEYQMIPYLLAENPSLTKEQAFAISKQMMDGQKWRAFLLDVSFLGWHLLSAMTLGILSIFYVNPYEHLTNAALYEALSKQNGRPAFAMSNTNVHYEQWVVMDEDDSHEQNGNTINEVRMSDGLVDEDKGSF